MLRIARTIFFLLGLVGLSTVAFAQTPPLGPPAGKIIAINGSGSSKYTSEQIAAACGLNLGEIVTKEEIQAAADRLARLGPFVNVRYRYTSHNEETTLEFMVNDGPTAPVSFDNFPWLGDEELTEGLRQALPFFEGNAPEHGTMVDVMTKTLEQLLAARGVHAVVEHELIGDPFGEGMIQQFRVVGASMNIEGVRFSDPLAGHTKTVQERLSDLVGKAYSRFAVELFLNDQVRPVYLQHGYLRVRFTQPLARFTAPPTGPPPSTVLVVVPIEPGPLFHWNGVEWTGNKAMAATVLNGFLPLQPGEVADGLKIQAGWQRVEEEYGRRGYMDVKVEPKAIFDDAAGRVLYRVAVTEGSPYRVGKLVITGLSLESEQKLREAWKMEPGAVFDKTYFDQFLTHITRPNKEIFGNIPVYYEEAGHWLRKNSANHTVDVLFDFK